MKYLKIFFILSFFSFCHAEDDTFNIIIQTKNQRYHINTSIENLLNAFDAKDIEKKIISLTFSFPEVKTEEELQPQFEQFDAIHFFIKMNYMWIENVYAHFFCKEKTRLYQAVERKDLEAVKYYFYHAEQTSVFYGRNTVYRPSIPCIKIMKFFYENDSEFSRKIHYLIEVKKFISVNDHALKLFISQ